MEGEKKSCRMYDRGMEHIGAHLKRTITRSKITERGELMRHFCNELNVTRRRDGLPLITMSRMGLLLEKIPTKDLYYFKRICEDAKDFSKKFWWELNPDNHTDVAKQAQMKKFLFERAKSGQ